MSSFEQPPQEKSSAPLLCTKGCGFFGCPNNQNMCSVCFINHRLATMSVDEVAPKDAVVEEEEAAVTPAEIRKMEAEEWKKRVNKATENPYYTNRCTRCLKKMGIAERFMCRCGKNYCAKHRLSEDHACGYDYQRAGIISIIRNNPLVQPDKLRDRM
jgi:hypothetical protein